MTQNIDSTVENQEAIVPSLRLIPFHFPNVPNVSCAFQMRETASLEPNANPATGPHNDATLRAYPLSHGNISLDIVGELSGHDPSLRQQALANRRAIASSLGVADWCEMLQVHGNIMHFEPEAQCPDSPSTVQGDGFATDQAHRALMIKTADCQPVLIAHLSGQHIAAFHIGWRGNRIQFLGHGIDAFCRRYNLDPRDLVAVRGPSLGPDAAQFTNFDAEWGPDFAPYFDQAKQTMNLWQLTHHQLCAAGLLPHNIYSLDLCTLSLPNAFFSYRRERHTGRQASFIWIRS
ncbi:MAG: polyphenol oxidase family protein [Pseudomonadota bacterium]